jgi:hypothetical protein
MGEALANYCPEKNVDWEYQNLLILCWYDWSEETPGVFCNSELRSIDFNVEWTVAQIYCEWGFRNYTFVMPVSLIVP